MTPVLQVQGGAGRCRRSWARGYIANGLNVREAAARFKIGKTARYAALQGESNRDVPVSLADKVDQLAARLERSRGWIVKQALTAWVDQEEERRRLTLEALADVEGGRVIDHREVQEWAASLGTDAPLPLPQ